MNFSTWSIRHPVPPIALFVVLVIVGLVSFVRLPVTRMPNIDLPVITVTIAQPGAAPSELTTQVIQPVEAAVSSIAGVRHIYARATEGVAAVTVEFELSTDSDRAINDIKDAVAGVRSDMPESATEPVIKRLDVTGQAILTYAVSDQTQSIEALSKFVDDVVSRRLQSVSAIGKVTRLGGAERQIQVELDPDRLLAQGLTAADVSRQLRAANVDLAGGRGDLAETEYSIRALGAAKTVDDLAATAIQIAGGRTIRLDQIGRVIDGASEARDFALFDGQPVVAFGIYRSSGASDLVAAEAAHAKLDEIVAEYPGITLSLIEDTSYYTEQSFDHAMETLWEGALLAVIVVLLFLRNWRATIIAAVALPLSAIPTFFAMDYLGFTLNAISLLGITLVTGILVDDAIVEIENIVRHIHMGKNAYDASMEAATEIGLTVIAISFSIVAVFAPVSFMGGIAGQYFKQFGLTVAISVLFSLLVARIITPMMAAYLMKDHVGHTEVKDGPIMRGFLRVLGWTLRHRLLTMLAGLGIFAASIYSATLLPTELMAKPDTGRAIIEAELPPGATLSETEALAQRLNDQIIAFPEVKNVFTQGGSSGVNTARFFVNFGPSDERERSAFAIADDIRAALETTPDVRMSFLNEVGGKDLTISALGDSEESAAAAANMLAQGMSDLSGLESVTTSAALNRPELQIHLRPEIASRIGVTSSTVAQTVRIATMGDSESNLAKFNAGDEQIPVMVRLEEDARSNLQSLSALRIPSAAGPVPLMAVADVNLSVGPSELSRYDQRFQTEVKANLTEGTTLGQAVAAVDALPQADNLPPGSEIKGSGDAEIMAEIFSSFGLAMGAGVMMVYVVLVLLFSSFVTPITILLSLPLAIGGAILALYATGNAIGLSVVIGFLMLTGIVTKNAIMLVEFAQTAMERGMAKTDAIMEAAHKRARPIVMTTVAMTAGMVPAAISHGAGAEFRSPMAIAVIGGLVLSTLLSLVFVPSLFSVIDALKDRMRAVLLYVLGGRRQGRS